MVLPEAQAIRRWYDCCRSSATPRLSSRTLPPCAIPSPAGGTSTAVMLCCVPASPAAPRTGSPSPLGRLSAALTRGLRAETAAASEAASTPASAAAAATADAACAAAAAASAAVAAAGFLLARPPGRSADVTSFPSAAPFPDTSNASPSPSSTLIPVCLQAMESSSASSTSISPLRRLVDLERDPRDASDMPDGERLDSSRALVF